MTEYNRLIALQNNKAVIEKSVCKLQRVAIKETQACPFDNNKKIWNKLKKMNRRLHHVNKQLRLFGEHKISNNK